MIGSGVHQYPVKIHAESHTHSASFFSGLSHDGLCKLHVPLINYQRYLSFNLMRVDKKGLQCKAEVHLLCAEKTQLCR